MRLRCGWMRVVEEIDEFVLRRVGQPMRVHTERDRGVLVSKLSTDARDRRTILQQLRREGVPQLMRAAAMQAGGVQHAVECLPHIRFVEGRTTDRREHPRRAWEPFPQPGHVLATSPQPQGDLQLTGEIDASPLMILRRGEVAADEIALHLDETVSPIEIGPLQGQEFAGAQSRPQSTEQPRMPIREPVAGHSEHLHRFLFAEGIDGGLGVVRGAKIFAKTQRRVCGQEFVFDRLRQDRAERPRNAAHRRGLQPFSATRRHEHAAIRPTQ